MAGDYLYLGNFHALTRQEPYEMDLQPDNPILVAYRGGLRIGMLGWSIDRRAQRLMHNGTPERSYG
jgi:hypothetical protein